MKEVIEQIIAADTDNFLELLLIAGLSFETDLEGGDLSGLMLRGLDFTGAILTDADLQDSDLEGARLERATLIDADLERCVLREADLRGATIANANFKNAILELADLGPPESGTLSSTGQSGESRSESGGTDATEANFVGAELRAANLTRANLTGADLRGADLREALLTEAIFNGANLTGARLWGTERTDWTVDDVVCEYAFWDLDGTQETYYVPGLFGIQEAHAPKGDMSSRDARERYRRDFWKAHVLKAKREYDIAKRALRELLSKVAHDTPMYATVVNYLADISRERGEYAIACLYYERAGYLFEKIGDRHRRNAVLQLEVHARNRAEDFTVCQLVVGDEALQQIDETAAQLAKALNCANEDVKIVDVYHQAKRLIATLPSIALERFIRLPVESKLLDKLHILNVMELPEVDILKLRRFLAESFEEGKLWSLLKEHSVVLSTNIDRLADKNEIVFRLIEDAYQRSQIDQLLRILERERPGTLQEYGPYEKATRNPGRHRRPASLTTAAGMRRQKTRQGIAGLAGLTVATITSLAIFFLVHVTANFVGTHDPSELWRPQLSGLWWLLMGPAGKYVGRAVRVAAAYQRGPALATWAVGSHVLGYDLGSTIGLAIAGGELEVILSSFFNELLALLFLDFSTVGVAYGSYLAYQEAR